MTPSRIGGITALLAAMMVAPWSATLVAAQTTTQSSADAPGEAAAIAKAKVDSARYPYTAADIHFMTGMIGHHAQAIVMAGWAPSHGASPSVLTLAERITNAQQDEIKTMQQWLRDRQQPVPDPLSGMKMMMNPSEMTMGASDHETLMPGMLTDAQMKQLDAARGPDFDRLFLTFMIQHHRGAVTMVKQLFDSYGAGQDEFIFKYASDVNVDQTTEIARMQRMLVAQIFGKDSQ
ncbi:MAG TPA: DUF305 domain-containing protein [Gemmatimonadaceae bacterium]